MRCAPSFVQLSPKNKNRIIFTRETMNDFTLYNLDLIISERRSKNVYLNIYMKLRWTKKIRNWIFQWNDFDMENGIFNGWRGTIISLIRASRSRYFFHEAKAGETRRSGMAGLEHVLETLHGRLFPWSARIRYLWLSQAIAYRYRFAKLSF